MSKNHVYGSGCSLSLAKMCNSKAVITIMKLVCNKANSLGYQYNFPSVGDKFINPICVIKTSGRASQGSDYRCLYWVPRGVKCGSNYWLGFIDVWEKDSSAPEGLRCLKSSPIDFSKCNSLSEVVTVVSTFLDDAFVAVSFE